MDSGAVYNLISNTNLSYIHPSLVFHRLRQEYPARYLHDRGTGLRGGEEKWRATYNTITVIQNFTKARITTCHLSRRDNHPVSFTESHHPTSW